MTKEVGTDDDERGRKIRRLRRVEEGREEERKMEKRKIGRRCKEARKKDVRGRKQGRKKRRT